MIDLEIGSPVHGGHCLARHDGRVVLVRHTLPGERVRARVTQRRKGFWRADAVEIVTPSPDRVLHVWPAAGPDGVGGGELGHVALPAQRRWKEQVLRDALTRIGGLDADDEHVAQVQVAAAPGESTGLGTRTRIELTVTAQGRAGMYAHRSNHVIALESMPLAHESLARLEVFQSPWRPGSRLDLVAPSDADPVVLVDGEPQTGRAAVTEVVDVGGTRYRYRVAAAGFWQVHRWAPTVLAEAVLGAVGDAAGARVLDGYSGAGLFTAPLAATVGEPGRVLAVESDARAGKDARRNAHALPQVDLAVADVGSWLWHTRPRLDVAVIDPPRAGAGAEVMTTLAELQVPRLVYVACDPAALARDLRTALDSGYRLQALQGYDLFPHTHHVEAVATLVR